MSNWDLIAIDTGGTFTDVVAISDTKFSVFKIASTPESPDEAVLRVIEQLTSSAQILHGTTVATNAILERKGAKVILITTKGFRDVLEIGRQNRDDIYAMYPSRTQPLVHREDRIEVNERITAEGEILVELQEDELDKLIQELSKRKNVESIAISLLFSFFNPTHENMITEKIQETFGEINISQSSNIHPEYREYERTSTTVIDAYVKPVMNKYLSSIIEFIEKYQASEIFAVMKSDSGLAKANSIVSKPVDTIFSGLAGGVKAAEFTSKLLDEPNLVTIDIGGTSTDVSAIRNGKGTVKTDLKLDNLPVARPAVDVITIGAGGGSLVEYEAGLITVGPESAGAEPGPISYDKGGNIPTITDTDLVLGLLPDSLAGGILKLNKTKALNGLNGFAGSIGLSLDDTIKGIRTIFHENIVGAIRSVSTQRGYDPREFSLLGFGGAGPLHAVEIAEIIGITKVIIPPYPGVWSSFGLLGADYEYTRSVSILRNLDDLSEQSQDMEKIFKELEHDLMRSIEVDGLEPKEARLERKVAVRFVGQSFDISIPYIGLPSIRKDFTDAHRELYGFAAEDEPIEIVSIILRAIIPTTKPNLPVQENKPSDNEELSELLDGQIVKIYQKNELSLSKRYLGPLIIRQDDTTIWIPKSWEAKVDHYGFIHIISIE